MSNPQNRSNLKDLSALSEEERILRVYAEREKRGKPGFFGYDDIAHLYRRQERSREALLLLRKVGFDSLAGISILDVGCGNGTALHDFLLWGAEPERLSGIELRPGPVEEMRRLIPRLDVRSGSGRNLPWPDGSFDLVCQHTVFSSILDPEIRQQVAQEMVRVLKKGGRILWYDFVFNNPSNPNVRGVGCREIPLLFPTLQVAGRRITLAPPIARRIPHVLMPILYPMLSAFTFLCTHYLGLFRKP